MKIKEKEKAFSYSLSNAKDIDQIFQILGSNKESLDITNVDAYLKQISNKMHTIHKETQSKFENDPNLHYLKQFINQNLKQFNEVALIETLVFMRKLTHMNLSKRIFSKDDENNVVNTINERIIGKNLNPKLASQFFQECAILKADTEIVFQFLKHSFQENKSEYFTQYALSCIISGLTKLTHEKRKYADFGYQTCILMEKWIDTTNIKQLCLLFNNICCLRLNIFTTHKRKVQILDTIREKLDQEKYSLNEDDYLNIIQGYALAPHTLDIKLLMYIKNSTLLTISDKPLNLSTDFLIKFIDSMSKQRIGLKLKPETLDMITGEIEKRARNMKIFKLYQIATLIDGLNEHNYINYRFTKFLYEIVVSTPAKDYNLGSSTTILIYFLKQGLDCNQLIEKVLSRFNAQFEDRSIESLTRLLYILTYPKVVQTELLNENKRNIFNILKKKIENNPRHNIYFFGNNYSTVKSEEFVTLRSIYLEWSSKNWESLNNFEKTNIALGFINSKNLSKEWEIFLKKKFEELDRDGLNDFLRLYEEYGKKNLIVSEFFLDTVSNSQFKESLFSKVLDGLIATPPVAFQTMRGTPTLKLKNMLNSFDFEKIDLENNLNHNHLMKISRLFNLINEDKSFLIKAVSFYLKTKITSNNSENNDFHLAELAELLVDLASNKDLSSKSELLEALKNLYQNLSKVIENNEYSKLTISYLIKLIKLHSFCQQEGIIKEDDVLSKQLVAELQKKVINLNPNTNFANIINAIVLIIDLEILGRTKPSENDSKINVEIFEVENLYYSISEMSFINNSYSFERSPQNNTIKNSAQQSERLEVCKLFTITIRPYFEVIEKFYMQSNIQILQNVVIDYLRFFALTGSKNSQLYTKLFTDFTKNGSLRPIFIIEFLKYVSILRISHKQTLKSLSEKILEYQNQYKKDLVDICYYYARIGVNEDWVKTFLSKTLEYIETIEYDFDTHPRKAAVLLWVLCLYDLKAPRLISKLVQGFEKYILQTSDWISNDFNKLIVNSIYQLFTLKYSLFDGYDLSSNSKIKLRESEISRNVVNKKIDEVEELLLDRKITFQNNFKVLDTLHADIFIKNQNILVFYMNHHFITFNRTESSGYQLMREKICKIYNPNIKIAFINQHHWGSLKTDDDKIVYLKKLGIEIQ